jgi:hypothetical protein
MTLALLSGRVVRAKLNCWSAGMATLASTAELIFACG